MKSPTLTPPQRTRVNALLDEVLDLPEPQRLRYLDRQGGDDSIVHAEVISLLRALDACGDFLTAPARPRLDDQLPDAALGTHLAAWRLNRIIGRGGMGDVYEALRIDGQFEQRVAIKLLRQGTVVEAQRFDAERRMLAGLQHPGIARLYDGGVTPDGRLYMVMEYIDGKPITEYCAATHATLAQRLNLFDLVCSAVAYAHEHHVIHRDLKSSNILVTHAGEVKLLDFGIAKVLDGQLARITQAVVGPLSPVCAAPEQLTGAPTTPATDVYALGVLLYELLTGSHPWMGVDTPMLQAMRIILERPAPLASRAAPQPGPAAIPARRIRGDLDAVIAKTLRKEPELRYRQVAYLQADIARFRRGAPVAARAGARWYPLRHAMSRHRWRLAGISLACIALLIGWRMAIRQAPLGAATHTVALLGFDNLSRQEHDAWLNTALTQMFGTDLSNTETLSVVPDELVRDVLRGMHITGAGNLGSDSLSRLGRELGADYIVSGSFLVGADSAGSTVRIDVVVQEVNRGRALTRFSEEANLPNVSQLVQRMGTSLRMKLGTPAADSNTLAQTASAQPPTVDVARLMGIAYDAMQHYDAVRERDALLQVIAEAPGFAPAYANLSEAWSALGYRDKAVASAEQALARGTGLSREMQTRIDAALQSAKYQWQQAATDWQTLVDLKPGNTEYRLQLIAASIAASDVPTAQSQLAQLLSLPEETGDPRVALAAARLAAFLDDSKASAEHAASAMALAAAIQAPGLAADAQSEFAGAQWHLGNLDVAESNCRTVIAAYHRLGNPRGEADARRQLAAVLGEQQQIDAARAEYQRAMAIDQGIGDSAGVAAIYRKITELLWDTGDRDGAQAAARRALEISRETGDLKLQSWTLRALATIASDDAASDDIMRDYEAVTALTERSGDRGGHVWSLASYADSARLRGEMPKARSACAQALHEAQALTDPQFTIYAVSTCALVEIDSGASDEAISMLQQVERLTRTSGPLYGANARLVLAQIARDNARCPQALELLDRVVTEFKAAESIAGEADAEAMRALCQQQLGNLAARDAALSRAKSLRRALTSRQEVYYVDIVAAELEHADSAPREAIARLSKVAADAEQRHWVAWSLEAKLAAWELAATHGERKLALRLRAELETSARAHDMGRILARLKLHPV